MTEDHKARTYRFVTCENCKKKLPVGGSWDVEIKCRNCGHVQEVEPNAK